MREVELRPLARSPRNIPRSDSPRSSPRSDSPRASSHRSSRTSDYGNKRRGRAEPLRSPSSSAEMLEWKLQTLCVLLCAVVVTLIFQLSLGHGRSHTRRPSRVRPGAWRGRGVPSSVCANYKRSHAQPAFNSSCIPTVLASYPGSGSTITRLLIEMTTGVWTGSIYGDGSLYNSLPHPFCGEMTTRSVVAIKSHGPWEGQHTVVFAKRAVLMLRSPFTAIPSYFNWFHTFHKKGAQAQQHQMQAPEEEWIQWRGNNVKNQTEAWVHHFSYWMDRFNSSDTLFVAKFDDLVHDGTSGPRVLSEIVNFLDFPGEFNRTKKVWHNTIYNRSSAVRREKSYKPTFTKAQTKFIFSQLKELKRKYGKRNKLVAGILGEYLADRRLYLD
mmetsp:Transcript_22031/g.63169  ORF Transcript_22031/g.63169 Transcript_22031/m.63169 type:complete len:383 (+) Transcript_22031:230-1378(+)